MQMKPSNSDARFATPARCKLAAYSPVPDGRFVFPERVFAGAAFFAFPVARRTVVVVDSPEGDDFLRWGFADFFLLAGCFLLVCLPRLAVEDFLRVDFFFAARFRDFFAAGFCFSAEDFADFFPGRFFGSFFLEAFFETLFFLTAFFGDFLAPLPLGASLRRSSGVSSSSSVVTPANRATRTNSVAVVISALRIALVR